MFFWHHFCIIAQIAICLILPIEQINASESWGIPSYEAIRNHPSVGGLIYHHMAKWTTPSEVRKWIMLNEKYSVPEIARMVKREKGTIYAQFKKINHAFLSFPNNRKKFSDEQIMKFYGEYVADTNTPLMSIAKKHQISRVSLYNRFHLLFLPMKPSEDVIRNYEINHNFFEKIDSEIKAYLLGFFAADGHIRPKSRSYELKISIHHKDSHILRLFNKHICNGKLKLHSRKDNTKTIGISSKQIGGDLKKLGYDNRKTYSCRHIPKLNKKLMNHFIRGYFDGDGSVSYSNRKLNGYRHTDRSFSIFAKNKNILVDILNEFPKSIRRKISIQNTNYEGYIMRTSKKSTLRIIHEFLYSNSKYFLKRKRIKFDRIICDGFLS